MEKSFGDWLHDLRLAKGFISARKTSQMLGISNVYLHEIEADMKIPSNEILVRMADLYKVPCEELVLHAIPKREKTSEAKRLAVARYIMSMPEDEFNKLTTQIRKEE